jgi:putative flippase GtrA
VISPKVRRFSHSTGVNLASSVVDYAFVLTLTHLFDVPMLQTIIAYTGAMLVNFKLQKAVALVGGMSQKSEQRVFMEFVGTGMLGLVSTAMVIWFSLNIMSSFPVVAKTIAILICFVVLYVARNRFVFNGNTGPSDAAVAGDETSRAVVRRVNPVESAEPLVIASVQAPERSNEVGSNIIVMATFAASRPRASKTLQIRGASFLGSNVYQWPPKNASNHAAKSPPG